MQDIKKLNLKVNRLVDSLFVGNYKTAFRGRGLQFSDYRAYSEGDDSKYIDFLASQREGKLLVKRFEEERELTVFFILDISKTMNFGGSDKTKIDTLIETFYILSLSGVKNNDKVGAIIFDEWGYSFIKPGKGIKNILRILEVIEKRSLKRQNDFSINKLISIFNNLPIKNSLIFLLTDKMGEIEDKNLKILSIKNDTIYINIFDYLENNLIDDDSIIRLKDSFKTFFINLKDKKKVIKYRELRKIKIQNFRNKLNNFKINYLQIDNKTNIFSKLIKFFKTR